MYTVSRPTDVLGQHSKCAKNMTHAQLTADLQSHTTPPRSNTGTGWRVTPNQELQGGMSLGNLRGWENDQYNRYGATHLTCHVQFNQQPMQVASRQVSVIVTHTGYARLVEGLISEFMDPVGSCMENGSPQVDR